MAFFSEEKLKRRVIEIDDSSVTCDSQEILSRLDRIGANYEKLGEILSQVEVQIANDERLSSIDEKLDDAALESNRKKKSRKWRTRSKPAAAKTGTRRKSAGPSKPR